MVQAIMAPMELVQSANIDEILFSGSESKWNIDPLELLSAPCCTICPGLRMKQTLFIVNNNEDIFFFRLCFISVH